MNIIYINRLAEQQLVGVKVPPLLCLFCSIVLYRLESNKCRYSQRVDLTVDQTGKPALQGLHEKCALMASITKVLTLLI